MKRVLSLLLSILLILCGCSPAKRVARSYLRMDHPMDQQHGWTRFDDMVLSYPDPDAVIKTLDRALRDLDGSPDPVWPPHGPGRDRTAPCRKRPSRLGADRFSCPLANNRESPALQAHSPKAATGTAAGSKHVSWSSICARPVEAVLIKKVHLFFALKYDIP